MAFTPICPACGTVRCDRLAGERIRCRDCGHQAPARRFDQTAAPWRAGNTEWRDPVALSMDGPDGSAP